MPTPSPKDLAEVLRLISLGEIPVPDHLSDAATYAIVAKLVDLDSITLTDKGNRVLRILGGTTPSGRN